MIQLLNTIKLLRFPFSVFLLPVSLFSFFYIQPKINYQLILILVVWHILVFPASNGYNSYHDRDEGPIGTLTAPPKPTKFLLYVTYFMDGSAILLSSLINIYFVVFVTIYIIVSRLYSNRKIRLKKYPISSFLIVFVFQGAWIFYANIFAFENFNLLSDKSVMFSAIASSFLIGTVYPLTQIYQHEADRKDGVNTLSMLLGKKTTFVFSASMFTLASLFIYLAFNNYEKINDFWIFNIIMLPATLYFLSWGIKSYKNPIHINFKNTMIMLVLSSLLNNFYFIILLIK